MPYEISAKAEELLTDKSIPLFVYCRSGRRSALAAKALNVLGYTSVCDFGGIIDWPYETVIEDHRYKGVYAHSYDPLFIILFM